MPVVVVVLFAVLALGILAADVCRKQKSTEENIRLLNSASVKSLQESSSTLDSVSSSLQDDYAD